MDYKCHQNYKYFDESNPLQNLISNVNNLDLEFYSNLDQVGAFMIGYRQKEGTGDTSIAPCFSVPRLPWIPASAETCESASGIAGPDSAYIRVFTFYGVCGENYTRTQGGGTSDFFSSEYPTSADAPTRGCRFR